MNLDGCADVIRSSFDYMSGVGGRVYEKGASLASRVWSVAMQVLQATSNYISSSLSSLRTRFTVAKPNIQLTQQMSASSAETSKAPHAQNPSLDEWLSIDFPDMSPYLPREISLRGTRELEFGVVDGQVIMYTTSECVVDGKAVANAMQLLKAPDRPGVLEIESVDLCYVINTDPISPELFFDVIQQMRVGQYLNEFKDVSSQIYITSQDCKNQRRQDWTFFNNEHGLKKVLQVVLMADDNGETNFVVYKPKA